MYDTNIIFHSNRQYPAIDKSGSKSFSVSSPTLIQLASGLSAEKRFIVFQESNGYRSIVKHQFINNGNLFAYIEFYSSISGTLHWRAYAD